MFKFIILRETSLFSRDSASQREFDEKLLEVRTAHEKKLGQLEKDRDKAEDEIRDKYKDIVSPSPVLLLRLFY